MAKLLSPKILLTLLGIFVILTLMFGWFGAPNLLSKINSANVNSPPGTGGAPVATPQQQCNPAPTITLQYADQYNGTPITFNVSQMKINGGNPIAIVSSGSGQISGGNSVQLLLGAPAYPATIVDTFTVGCSTNPTPGTLISQKTFPSLSVIGSGNALLGNKTAAAAGVNETNTSSALTQTLRINPAAYQTTGYLVLVVDANSTAKVASITSALSPYSKGKPVFYTPIGTSSQLAEFVIPASVAQLNIPITFNPASGADLGNLLIMYTLYQAQGIQDTNGQFVPNQIQDSLNNGKFFASGMTEDYVSP